MMKVYDSYKDSGVDWIGEIPTNWKSKRFSYSIKIQKGKLPKKLTDEKSIDSLPYLSMGVLRGNDPTEFSNESGIIHVLKGDIGLLWDGSNSGEVVRINREGILSSTVSLLSLNDNSIDKEFCFYLLKFYENDFRENTNGMGIPHVNGDHVRESKLIIPSLIEQQQIVSFLDTKTSLIDSLIENTKRKIKLLTEKKISLINEVVTKGLNPNVEMKDSGVEWIGEIPSDWEMTKIRFISLLKDQRNDVGSERKMLSVSQYLGVIYKDYQDESLELTSEESSRYWVVQDGDLVVNTMWLQFCGIGVSFGVEGYVSPDYKVYCLDKGKVFPRYVHFLLRSSRYLNLYSRYLRGIRPNSSRVGTHDFQRFDVPLPSLNEQIEISNQIEHSLKQLDIVREKETRRIELLQEYRQSLISLVVTGKVRITEDVI